MGRNEIISFGAVGGGDGVVIVPVETMAARSGASLGFFDSEFSLDSF